MEETYKISSILSAKHTRRLIVEAVLIILFAGILAHLLNEHAPKILTILESGNAGKINDYLMKYGTEGKFLLILLQIIETVSIVLPAVPVYICSGIMFGKLAGILVCYSVNLILNLIIFLVARRLSESTHRQYDIGKHRFIGEMVSKAKHMDRVVLAMCLLPVVPNGMIPYLSAQIRVTPQQFMKALAVGSLPSIVVYVCCGKFLVSESYKLMAPLIVVLVIVSVIAFIFRNKLITWLKPKVIGFIEG